MAQLAPAYHRQVHTASHPEVAALSICESIPRGTMCFDTDVKLTAESAAALRQRGFRGAIRYVGRDVPQSSGDLDAPEARHILDAGLGLMLVQHAPVRATPMVELGARWGNAAVENALRAGYVAGATLSCDAENLRGGSPKEYLNAWFKVVRDGGYEPMLYFTADIGLTPDELFYDLSCKLYWRGGSRDAPLVAVRGACLQQYFSAPHAGIDLDVDVVLGDALDGVPHWMRGV